VWCVWQGDEHFQSQEQVYQSLGAEVLENALQGYNACIFAYGESCYPVLLLLARGILLQSLTFPFPLCVTFTCSVSSKFSVRPHAHSHLLGVCASECQPQVKRAREKRTACSLFSYTLPLTIGPEERSRLAPLGLAAHVTVSSAIASDDPCPPLAPLWSNPAFCDSRFS
jgi:hypothetical protein